MREGSVRYTAKVALELCERIAAGATVRDIDRQPDMPYWASLRTWLLRHDEFAVMYQRAQAAKADWEFAGLDELENQVINGEVDANAARIALDSKKWRLSKMKPSSYSDHRHHQVTVGVGNSFARLLQSLDDRPMLDVTPRRDGNN